MSDMRVNVNVDTLRTFSDEVKTFKDQIGADCLDLTEALERLRTSMDVYTIASMADTVKRIERILDDAEPLLKELGARVDAYADFVDRLKQIASRS